MSPPPVLASRRILVCDDYGTFRRLIARELTERGYAVTMADDATEAARLLLEAEEPCQAFDVVLMDYQMRMPSMTGGEAVNLMRARCPDQAVVYVTGRELPSDLVTHEIVLMKGGLDIDTLVEALELAMRRKADTEPPPPPSAPLPTKPDNPKGGGSNG